MTRFVDVPTLSRMVERVGLSEFIAGIANTMREDFRRWESFDKSARVANHSEVGVIELMPVSDPNRYAFKYVNGHPGNPDKGVSTVMAFGALADTDTGISSITPTSL
jgi:ornithine cyclodeaminase